MTFHCFFEQSGTFKNEFKKLGYEAYDYDILNDFGETDFQVDLFHDIEIAYERERERTVFDNVKEGDQIIAFFPCTRFEKQIALSFRGDQHGMEKWSDEQKIRKCMRIHKDLDKMYQLISMMSVVCIERGIPLIIENPYTTDHYLTRYWCIKPSLIDRDRSERGDYFKKPTQYWFFNRKPSNNLVYDAVAQHPRKRITALVKDGGVNGKVERSLISKDYANRFIREFII